MEQKFGVPLALQPRRDDDQDACVGVAADRIRDNPARLNRLAETHFVGEEEAGVPGRGRKRRRQLIGKDSGTNVIDAEALRTIPRGVLPEPRRPLPQSDSPNSRFRLDKPESIDRREQHCRSCGVREMYLGAVGVAEAGVNAPALAPRDDDRAGWQ